MNIKTLKRLLLTKDLHMSVGQQQWQWDSRQMYHGSCVSKVMLLILCYQVFGGEPYIRSAEDIAFHVTLFIAKNGSYVNYYMFHGGTNFGRTGAAYVTRSYYDQAPLDEYGLIRQPKWGYLKQLHAAMKSCSMTLLQGVRTNFSLGQLQEAYIFQEGSGGCVAFLVNNNGRDSATVQFHNVSFELLPKSISILPDCQNVIFNTATVKTESNERTTTSSEMFDSMEKWEEFKDVIPNFLDMSIKSFTLLEHMNMTKDESDYLWYTFRFQQNLNCTKPLLHIESLGHIVHAFANKMYFGAAHGSHDVKGFTFENSILLNNDITNISILSVMVALPDSGPFLENRFAGLTNVEIQCSEGIAYNFTDKEFGYQLNSSI